VVTISDRTNELTQHFTDRFSGPGRVTVTSPVCVCDCVPKQMLLDLVVHRDPIMYM